MGEVWLRCQTDAFLTDEARGYVELSLTGELGGERGCICGITKTGLSLGTSGLISSTTSTSFPEGKIIGTFSYGSGMGRNNSPCLVSPVSYEA